MIEYGIYIFAGIVVDLLVTLQMRSVVYHKAWLASLLTFAITMIALLVIDNFVKSNDVFLLVSYALGTGIGTLFGMKMSMDRRKKK